ncbi:plasmid pRiA4b ORF-3 family protein [Salinisphaera hydrothermalis]|uniref:plasmid pRiA4b ORF-3 family protein n=1 Tax=Salinisphaera hydrothermalis TaxID=563188 RepID=UPI003340BDD1
MTDIVLRVELLDVEPRIWRRFVVPAQINLRRLHDVIQIVMGWEGEHLYEFEHDGRRYGELDPFGDLGMDDVAQAVNLKLCTLISRLADSEFRYLYDFGDSWEHRIVVEETSLEMSAPCPRLLDGAMACPPEDIGGALGYASLKAALAGDADEHGEMLLEVIGSDFAPNEFDKSRAAAELVPIQKRFRRL